MNKLGRAEKYLRELEKKPEEEDDDEEEESQAQDMPIPGNQHDRYGFG